MVESTLEFEPGLRDLHERLRRIAYRIGIVGLVLVCTAFLLSAATGVLKPTSYFEAVTYCLILGAISLAARRDYHIERVLHGGLALLFLSYWAYTLYEFHIGAVDPNSLMFVLFIPVFIAIGLDFRLQFALAPVHAGLVWYCFGAFAEIFHGPGSTTVNETALGITLAAFSAILLFLLGMVQIARQKTDLRLVEVIAEKNRLATTDPLTGLLNRRAFLDALEASAKSNGTVTLAFIDLNNFKPLNDQYGHAAGDAVLKAIASRLERCEAISVAARPGGDEFAAILNPFLDQAGVDVAMADLYEELVCDVAWDDRLIHVGASMGYADMKGEGAETDLQACLNQADTAMRRVKATGGGYARFTEAVDGPEVRTERLNITFPRALATGLIRPALQPIADASSLDIVGHELLARWTGPKSGAESPRQPGPDEFIPVAEKLGLLNELLWTTLHTTLSNWPDTIRALSVNISPGQLQTPDFVTTLRRVIDKHGFAASAVTLEITEKVALRNLGANVKVLERARRAGMSIALDDFGTGYSSLSLLSQLPLDTLKIDQSLVHAANKSKDGPETAILRGALQLAREIGLKSCVEGVNSEALATQMKTLGADQIQGYWIGRPKLVETQKDEILLAS